MKGSNFYRESISELIKIPQTVLALKRLCKSLLRQFLKLERVNKGMKVECLAKVIKIYLLFHGDEFFKVCAQETASEFGPSAAPGVEHKLIRIGQEVNW